MKAAVEFLKVKVLVIKIMKNNRRKILLIVIGIIIISNLPPVYYFIGEDYHYQNLDASFEFTEQPGTNQNFDVASRRFESFKKNNSQNPNHILYRSFRLKPWQFWEWWNMISNYKKFDLEVISSHS